MSRLALDHPFLPSQISKVNPYKTRKVSRGEVSAGYTPTRQARAGPSRKPVTKTPGNQTQAKSDLNQIRLKSRKPVTTRLADVEAVEERQPGRRRGARTAPRPVITGRPTRHSSRRGYRDCRALDGGHDQQRDPDTGRIETRCGQCTRRSTGAPSRQHGRRRSPQVTESQRAMASVGSRAYARVLLHGPSIFRLF
jgi:hypothetical protein